MSDNLLFKRSCRLFSSPSLLEGVGRVMDLWGTYDVYNTNPTAEESDAEALYSDWASVGDHLISAAQDLFYAR